MGYTISIIGAAGKMGKWFFSYFKSIKNQGMQKNTLLNIDKILLYDLKKIDYQSEIEDNNTSIERSLQDTIKNSDIMIFCIPVEGIKIIIEYNMDLFKKNTTIVEISSIKGPIFKFLQENFNKNSDMITLSIHPMYGPGASISSTNKILHLPVNNAKQELEKAKLNELFPKYEKIIIEGADEHDYSISIIISLIYFINLVFLNFLLERANKKNSDKKDNLSKSWQNSTDVINKTQLILGESILTDDIFLFLMLFIYNNKSFDTFKKYSQNFKELLCIIKKNRNFSEQWYKIKEGISKKININKYHDNFFNIDSHKKQKIFDKQESQETLYLKVLVDFINLAFSRFLLEISNTDKINLQSLEKISGSSFKIQTMVYSSVLKEEFYFLKNQIYEKESYNIINRYGQKINELLNKIEIKDENFIINYVKQIKMNVSKNTDVNESYKILYKILTDHNNT